MNADQIIPDKYLSHRLYGYGDGKYTRNSLQLAIDSTASHIEIDIRISKDLKCFVYHDPSTGEELGHKVRLCDYDSDVISRMRYKNGESILDLNTALSLFRDKRGQDQILCLDIKDCGAEEYILDRIRAHDLNDAIVLISWIPRVLIRCYSLKCNTPLFLSHVNLSGLTWVLRKGALRLTANHIFRLYHFVFIGISRYADVSEDYNAGFQHIVLLEKIPMALLDILALSNGGICLSKRTINDTLLSYVRMTKLRLWVFSIKNKNEYEKYERMQDVDKVFCDF